MGFQKVDIGCIYCIGRTEREAESTFLPDKSKKQAVGLARVMREKKQEIREKLREMAGERVERGAGLEITSELVLGLFR